MSICGSCCVLVATNWLQVSPDQTIKPDQGILREYIYCLSDSATDLNAKRQNQDNQGKSEDLHNNAPL